MSMGMGGVLSAFLTWASIPPAIPPDGNELSSTYTMRPAEARRRRCASMVGFLDS
eukprot:CAMPEP_0185158582 /NCGR_PEP_ID=MMETSP1139-20130426/2502_1 /TAXON_ID=298111 /ORGANISM="Pavlova sp., Strain CCMP459" /LENGTH=54 /DNA_ID=CAMNT_0027723725 /DNA_START=822 /DNA_END=986 /DNA_ORIENTATION=-